MMVGTSGFEMTISGICPLFDIMQSPDKIIIIIITKCLKQIIYSSLKSELLAHILIYNDFIILNFAHNKQSYPPITQQLYDRK